MVSSISLVICVGAINLCNGTVPPCQTREWCGPYKALLPRAALSGTGSQLLYSLTSDTTLPFGSCMYVKERTPIFHGNPLQIYEKLFINTLSRPNICHIYSIIFFRRHFHNININVSVYLSLQFFVGIAVCPFCKFLIKVTAAEYEAIFIFIGLIYLHTLFFKKASFSPS